MKKLFKRFSAALTMFIESVRMSVSNICHNRMRSFLTILGIMIGVTAVIALITTISAVSTTISDSFTSMGAGTMTLSAPGSDLKAGLSADDLETLTALAHVEGVSPTVTLNWSILSTVSVPSRGLGSSSWLRMKNLRLTIAKCFRPLAGFRF